jgi:hypothetical protein
MLEFLQSGRICVRLNARCSKAQAVKVDLDNGLVTVVMARAGALTDAQAKKLINDSGFNLVKITRAGAPS